MWNHTVFVLWGQHLILFCGRWEGGQRFTVVRAQEGIHRQESLCDCLRTYFILMEYSHQTASRSACRLCCHDGSAQGSPLCSWKGRIMGNSRAGKCSPWLLGHHSNRQTVHIFTAPSFPPLAFLFPAPPSLLLCRAQAYWPAKSWLMCLFLLKALFLGWRPGLRALMLPQN